MGQYEDFWVQLHVKDQLLLHISVSNIQQYEFKNNNDLDNSNGGTIFKF